MATGLLPIAHSLSALPRGFFTSLQSPPSSSSSPLISGSLHFVPRVYNFTADAHDRTSRWPASLNIVKGFHTARALRDSGLAVLDYSFDDGEEDLPAVEEGLEISKLGFAKEIVSALARKGITKLFPIQRAVLEPAMQGRDMVGRARTGTGKTLAFGIPILDKIIRLKEKQRRRRNPLAIVLAPTRELARQVEKEFSESAPSVETLCVYGGAPIQRQMSTLDRGVDVVVGTPGRLIDLLNRGSLNLSEVQFVVLDEADQMLNVGFAEDVETILEHIRQTHQTMMFSATMPSWILKLTRRFLKNPVNIDLVGDSDQKLADGISLYSIASETHEKSAIIGPLITEHAKGGKCIVFTKTKRDADRLASFMSRSFKCEALHGDISQSQRERTLSRFRDGRFNILVATDVASRGLDVPNVDLVVHYELPNSSEIFVHRSGRTGRAGKKGSAILIHSSRQHRDVKGIGQEVGCRFTELPKIATEGGTIDLFDDYGGNGGSRFGSSRFSSPSIDRFGSREKSGSSGYGGAYSGRSSSYGGPPSGEGRFKGSNAGRSGSSSGFRSGRSDSYSGGFKSGRSGGYGNSRGSERQGGYGNSGGSDRSSGFENSRGYGNSRGSERQGGYSNFGGSDRSSGFENFGGSSKSGSSDGNGSFNPGRKSRSSLFDDLFDDDKIGGSKSGSAFF